MYKNKKKVLVVKDLSKTYGDLMAVNHINLEVNKGEVFGLLGHNGAGKSTTIDCILGTKKFDNGEIKLLGLNPHKNRKELFEKVGVQFQDSCYQDKIKVKEICTLTQVLYKKKQDLTELLKAFSLQDKKNNYVAELSGGERQKLSVLLSFIHKPEILFLDELTTGLDPESRRIIWKYIKILNEQGTTIFLTSHYMDEVSYLCDRICILRKGQIVITDTVLNVIETSGRQTLEDAYLYFTNKEEF